LGHSTPSSIDGTHSHTLLEYCIKNGNGKVADPHGFIGTILQDHEGKFGVDAGRADRVKVAVDYINSRLAELGTAAKVIAEQRVCPSKLLGRTDMGGTVDVQIICGPLVELIDYKDGFIPVEVEGNKQLEQYAFGVMAEMLTKGEPVFTVRMTIIQPKVALKGIEPVSSVLVDASSLLGDKMVEIVAEAAATDDPNAPFVPGEKQCGFCPHRGACKAATEHALAASGIKFEKMDVAKDAADQQPTTMTDEQLSELITSAPLLRKLIEAAEEEALRRITSGHPVAGLKVVRGPGRRAWSLPDEDVAEKLKRMKVPKDHIFKTTVISPAQIDKLQWEDRAGNVCRLTERQEKTIARDMIAKTEGRLLVVPEADGRTGQQFIDPSSLFKAVPTDSIPSWMA
jgi:hypothetical protein